MGTVIHLPQKPSNDYSHGLSVTDFTIDDRNLYTKDYKKLNEFNYVFLPNEVAHFLEKDNRDFELLGDKYYRIGGAISYKKFILKHMTTDTLSGKKTNIVTIGDSDKFNEICYSEIYGRVFALTRKQVSALDKLFFHMMESRRKTSIFLLLDQRHKSSQLARPYVKCWYYEVDDKFHHHLKSTTMVLKDRINGKMVSSALMSHSFYSLDDLYKTV